MLARYWQRMLPCSNGSRARPAIAQQLDWTRHPRIVRAASALAAGAVVAYPTEAVWGLGCDPGNAEAVMRLLSLKRRPASKGLILIAASVEQLLPLTRGLSEQHWAEIRQQHSWPITWLVPASAEISSWLTGGRESIAVRVTRHPVAAALCSRFGGALVSTSANPTGLPPARNAWKVRTYFGQEVDEIAPGRVGLHRRPSEIRDLLSGKLIRSGG